MSGSFLLDWAVFTVSLFNTVVLLWLGLTVLLNAEHRTWGLWLAGGGLLAGCAFFISHTAILGLELTSLDLNIDFWWRAGWGALIVLPFAWYVLMLWYVGFWTDVDSQLHLNQRPVFILMALATGLLLVFLLTTHALPTYGDTVQLGYARMLGVRRLPWPIVVYPLYSVVCIGLSIRVLAHTQPLPRPMGELARRRARPWLVGTSISLLVASLLVAAAVGWVGVNGMQRFSARGFRGAGALVVWFDLVVALLIAVAIVLLGQAIVVYEIFTGQSLPRKGFFRHWRRVIILAGGYSLVIGWSLSRGLPSIYGLLLTALVMITFYALLVWRSFDDRERAISQLRPFVRSQETYQQLLGSGASSGIDAAAVFRALCQDVLDAQCGRLLPAGSAAAIVTVSLAYPEDPYPQPVLIQSLVDRFRETPCVYVDVDPAFYDRAQWAVSLWREQGLIGVLLLGPKTSGGLYMQEEIELAQAAGERLIDLQSSAEMGRRLMALQRQRLIETQIADQRVRRILHDDVLPKLHAAMLMLGTDDLGRETVDLLSETHHQIADLLHELPTPGAPEVARWGVIGALRHVVEQELAGVFDSVRWEIAPAAEARSRRLSQLEAEVLFFAAREAVRNAARYGRDAEGARPLTLTISLLGGDSLVLSIADDGVGIMPDDSPAQGAGQGLALHSTMMAVIGGTLDIDSGLDYGTRVTLTIAGSPSLPETSTRSL